MRINQDYYTIISPDDDSTVYINLTRRFPKRLSQGNECIFIDYHFNSNCIFSQSIKRRKGETITEAQDKLHAIFKKVEVPPETHVLDNKVSKDLTDSFNKECIK